MADIGRPTDYSDEILKKAQDYLYVLPEGEAVHTVEGLALQLGVSRDTVYAWCKEQGKEAFSDIVSQLRTKKSFGLQNKALKKEVDSGVAKLLLGHEGYRDNHDITSDNKSVTFNTVMYGNNNDTSRVSAEELPSPSSESTG